MCFWRYVPGAGFNGITQLSPIMTITMTELLLLLIFIVLVKIYNTQRIYRSNARLSIKQVLANTKELFSWLWASLLFVVILFLGLSLLAFILGLVTKEMFGITSYWFYNSTWE